MIEHFLFNLLSNNVGVSALVSARVYPVLPPQNVIFPCVVFNASPDQEDATFDGQGTFQRIDAEIDVWSETHADALTLGDAVKTAIKNYSGILSGVTVDAIHIDSIVTVFEESADKYRQTILATIYKR